jgi:biopolymer transport protein ExbB/TolQ
MDFNVIAAWQHMTLPGLIIAITLLVMGGASLTVLVERLITLKRSRADSQRFASQVGSDISEGRFDSVIEETGKYKRGHLPRIVRAGLSTFQHAQRTADVAGVPPVERTRRFVERFMEEVAADLRRGMSVLASVGSTAPFVGLLGTVVGIIATFQAIEASGSGGLSTVSAGIAEALIVTALGLAVAIPAVLAFNFLSGKIAQEELMLNHSAAELLDAIDDWAERMAEGHVVQPSKTRPVDGEAVVSHFSPAGSEAAA